MKRKILVTLIVAVLVLVGVFSFAGWRSARITKARHERMVAAERSAIWQDLKKSLARTIRRFPDDPGIVIIDLENNAALVHERNMMVPSASMVKVPIMAAVFRAAEEGKIRLNQTIVLRKGDKMGGSGILKRMPVGTTYTVMDLVRLMIAESDNTATNILTRLLGIDYLNSAFRSFGLKHTMLTRRVADYQARDKRSLENYTTASDMARLLREMYRGKLINPKVSAECIEIMKLSHSTDRIRRYLPGEAMVAHKTGLERTVCHDAGIVFTPHGDFLIVVLVRHDNRSASAAKAFIARVSSTAYDHLVRLWAIGGKGKEGGG